MTSPTLPGVSSKPGAASAARATNSRIAAEAPAASHEAPGSGSRAAARGTSVAADAERLAAGGQDAQPRRGA